MCGGVGGVPVAPGREYVGPGLLYIAAMGPLGLWGFQGPTHTSTGMMSVEKQELLKLLVNK